MRSSADRESLINQAMFVFARAAVYATLFGIGKIVFGYTGAGVFMLAIAAAAFYWISRSFRGETAS